MKKMKVIAAVILTIAKAENENKVLTQHVTSWSADI